jgi:hypothetical protein
MVHLRFSVLLNRLGIVLSHQVDSERLGFVHRGPHAGTASERLDPSRRETQEHRQECLCHSERGWRQLDQQSSQRRCGLFLSGADGEAHQERVDVGYFHAAIGGQVLEDLHLQACIAYRGRQLFSGPSKVVTSSIFMPRFSCAVGEPEGSLLEADSGGLAAFPGAELALA